MLSVAQLANMVRVLNCLTIQGLASCTARGEGLSIPALHLCVCMCMCKKIEGPSELIGSEGNKGGALQKKNPVEMFTQEKEEEATDSFGGGERESRRGFQILRLFFTMFSP